MVAYIYHRGNKILKSKYLAVLIVATVASIANPVSAQGSRNIDGKGYSLSGDSLMGINERTANEDFPVFFRTQPVNATPFNSGEQNTNNNNSWRLGEEYTPITLEPAEENINGNDGLQLKFDLTNTNQRQD